ncbi:MAG: hypothetical protein GX235_10960 [Clostridiales bacterium]|nr:hypothetical protein [Clostridiales bacterium]
MKAARLNGVAELGTSMGGSNKNSKSGEGKERMNKGVIFAADINNIARNSVEEKRAQARKQASKIVKDQFTADVHVTDSLKEIREKIYELREQKASLNQCKGDAIKEQESLKEIYGIEDGSKEQQDLELIRKAHNAIKCGKLGGLSEEELTRVSNMGELTEYQKEALALDGVIENYDSLINDVDNEIADNTRAIADTKIDMLKQKGMRKVSDTADQIMKVASEEIIGMLKAEAIEHIDEEMDELVEKAKEAAEKKEKKEEQLEEIKSENEKREEFAESTEDNALEQDELQQKIDKILKDAGLLKEDIKGLVVDGLL